MTTLRRASQAFLGASLLAGTMAANAASISSQLFTNQTNLLSDNSLNWLVNSDGSLSGGGDTMIEADDKIRAIFQIETIEDLSGGGGTNNLGGGGVNELTFVEQLRVVSTDDADMNGLFEVVLGPDPAFATEWEGKLGLAAGTLAGAVAVGFEDTTPDFERTDTGMGTQAARLAALEATATDGTFVLAIGFTGDADELIATNAQLASLDVTDIKSTPVPGSAGSFAFQQGFIPGTNSLFAEWDQVPANVALDDGLVDINGTVDILGTSGATTPGDWFDDFNAVIKPVPEPGLHVLIGFGLLALGLGHLSRGRRAGRQVAA